MSIRLHVTRKEQANGYGRWEQCVRCGMAVHSGFYWLAGYKSKDAFGHRARARAIERAWAAREQDFEALRAIPEDAPLEMLAWCKSLPGVGDDTQYHLAKNFGAPTCKPDIWLCRLAGIPDFPRRPAKERYRACQDLCERLAEATGDTVPAVDTMLWLACNKRVLSVSPEAGPVSFVSPESTQGQEITPMAREDAAKAAQLQGGTRLRQGDLFEVE